MKIRKYLVALILILSPILSFAKVMVVTTTEDLASIAREVGGDLVQVESIGKGYMDPHFIDAKPSYLLKLKKADLFIEIGLELEVGWAPPLLIGARNPKILPGAPGFMEASKGCDVLQTISGQIDRSMGDVHPFGNPHFWLDPDNGAVIAKNIAAKLGEIDPSNTKSYQESFKKFESTLKAKDKEWQAAMVPYKGSRIVTYHNSWPNFAKHFGFDIVGFVELRPGIPPTPSHIQKLTEQIKREKIPLILMEPYFDSKLPKRIADSSGAQLIPFAPSVGAEPTIKNYFDLFDYNIQLLTASLAGGKNK